MHVPQNDLPGGQEYANTSLLVLLHGGGLSHLMYKDMIPILAGYGYAVDVLALDAHDQRNSDERFTFRKASEYLQEAITALKMGKHTGKINFGKITLVGVSWGAQVALDFLRRHPVCVDSAIVSGASIHPPDEQAGWEEPHMADDGMWKKIVAEDVNAMGMQNAAAIQRQSVAFTFKPRETLSLPPVLVVVGEHDTAMARRDYKELLQILQAANAKSQGLVIEDAWHNHPIDIPERFAELVHQWVQSQS